MRFNHVQVSLDQTGWSTGAPTYLSLKIWGDNTILVSVVHKHPKKDDSTKEEEETHAVAVKLDELRNAVVVLDEAYYDPDQEQECSSCGVRLNG